MRSIREGSYIIAELGTLNLYSLPELCSEAVKVERAAVVLQVEEYPCTFTYQCLDMFDEMGVFCI